MNLFDHVSFVNAIMIQRMFKKWVYMCMCAYACECTCVCVIEYLKSLQKH